jgi:sulfate adenylyltransferase subunit 1
VATDVSALVREFGLPEAHVIPVSALAGDNVVERSANTPWYEGPSLLELLESLPSLDELETELEALRMPVQLVIRPQGAVAAGVDDPERFRDYRAVAGRIASGTVRVGDAVQVFPGGATTTVTGIDAGPRELDEASAPQSVSLRLADELDAARGAVVVAAGALPTPRRELDAALFWLAASPLRPGARVLVKSGTSTVQALVATIHGRRDLDSLALEPADGLEVNDIGQATIRLASELPVEEYAAHRRAGGFLVIDPQSGATLAAGIVTAPVTQTAGISGTSTTTTDTEGAAA